MKGFAILKITLALLATILLGAFAWLWYNNQKHIDPLPILTYDPKSTVQNEALQKKAIDTAVIIQADRALKPALDEVLSRFNQRFPDLTLNIHYVDQSQVLAVKNQTQAPIDLIISNQHILPNQLKAMQTVIDNDRAKNETAQTLSPFGFALVSNQAIDGVIITDNPIATQFRNFLISSIGQEILARHGFNSIDNYKNQVDDLFNPKVDINSKSNTALDLEGVLEDRR